MANEGVKGCGTLLQNNSTGSYVTVAEIVNVTPPSQEVPMVDMTDIESTFEESVPGCVLVQGELQATIKYVPTGTTHKALLSDMLAKNTLGWKVIYADGSSSEWSFSGWIRTFVPSSIQHDNRVEAAFSVKLTSAITTPS